MDAYGHVNNAVFNNMFDTGTVADSNEGLGICTCTVHYVTAEGLGMGIESVKVQMEVLVWLQNVRV